VVEAVAPRPVNVLRPGGTDFTVADFAALGVRRISVGGSLARVAWTSFIKAAREMASEGRFDAFASSVNNAELNDFFRNDLKQR